MAEIRQATILIRDRQVTGGAIPSTAFMAEPFVNLYDGVLRFSGVTGGGYEPSSSSSVFEVGSTLYNSKITNRLNINDNFIISGGTGIISTYEGTTSLTGKFLSGGTTGLVLADISDIAGASAGAAGDIQFNDGSNGFAADGNFNYNDSTDTLSVPSFSANSFSATTSMFSGGTSLETIIYDISSTITGDHTAVQGGTNITTGGTSLVPIINVVDSPSFNNLTFSGTATGGNITANDIITNTLSAITSVSATTIFSGGTSLETIIENIASEQGDKTRVQPGTNVSTGGTDNFPIVNVIDSPIFAGLVSATGFTDSSLTAGRVTYAGAGGRLTDEAGFEYDEGANLLKAQNIQIGNPGDSGTTTTIYGDLIVMGQGISGFTSELYIEDNLIELNYNPTASTVSTSLGAGWSIQDGSGVGGTDVFWDIRGTATGVANRSFATNLNDIRIRETGTISSPNGVRVIAENDVIDGGSY